MRITNKYKDTALILIPYWDMQKIAEENGYHETYGGNWLMAGVHNSLSSEPLEVVVKRILEQH